VSKVLNFISLLSLSLSLCLKRNKKIGIIDVIFVRTVYCGNRLKLESALKLMMTMMMIIIIIIIIIFRKYQSYIPGNHEIK